MLAFHHFLILVYLFVSRAWNPSSPSGSGFLSSYFLNPWLGAHLEFRSWDWLLLRTLIVLQIDILLLEFPQIHRLGFPVYLLVSWAWNPSSPSGSGFLSRSFLTPWLGAHLKLRSWKWLLLRTQIVCYNTMGSWENFFNFSSRDMIHNFLVFTLFPVL